MENNSGLFMFALFSKIKNYRSLDNSKIILGYRYLSKIN